MFIDIGTEEIDILLEYMGGLIGDLMPLILVILGIVLALFIFNRLVNR
jgi:hypothetical protein